MFVNILTKGLVTPNSHAFLYPLLKYDKELLQEGIILKIFKGIEDSIFECDVLIVEHNYFSQDWKRDNNRVLEEISELNNRTNKLFYFDITDSAGLDHFEFLPYVTSVFKNQIFKNKDNYMKPLYGYRLFTDFYHENYNVIDTNQDYTSPVKNKADLNKIKVGWNSSMSDYSYLGLYKLFLYKKVAFKYLLTLPILVGRDSKERTINLSCRFNSNYDRETVAYQRKKIKALLNNYMDSTKVSRRKFFNEIKTSKIVVSPFGFGELCYRDYETFLYGGLLLKPDMSHIDTWPPLYDEEETYIPFDWSMSNLEEKIEEIIINYADFEAIAKNGKERYKSYVSGEKSSELFVEHFKEILES